MPSLVFIGPGIPLYPSIIPNTAKHQFVTPGPEGLISIEKFKLNQTLKPNLILMNGHESISENGEFYLGVNLFSEHHGERGSISKQMALLQKKTGIKTFYIFSCFSGIITNFLSDPANLEALGLEPGTRIVTFSNSKNLSLAFKNHNMMQEILDLPEQQIDHDTLERNLSVQLGVTVKSCVINRSPDGKWSTKTEKCNLHKHPEVWQELIKPNGKTGLDTNQESRLKDLKARSANLSKEEGKELKKLQEIKNLYEIYKDSKSSIPDSFPTMAFAESIIRGKQDRAVAWLNTGKIDLDFQTTNNGSSLLMLAIIGGNNELVKLLLEKGAKIEQISNGAQTAIMYAAAYKNVQAIETLAMKANINAQDRNGMTPLMHCLVSPFKSQTPDLEVIKLLLARGANPKMKNESGKTALDYTENEEVKKLLSSHPSQDVKKPLGSLVMDLSQEKGAKL